MDLDTALRALARARKGLACPQGRVARRNARRKVIGLLKRVRNALDREYPGIDKPRPPAPPKPEPPPKPVMEPRRPLVPRRALTFWAHRLFVRLVFAVYGLEEMPAPFAQGWRDLTFELADAVYRRRPPVCGETMEMGFRKVENEIADLYTRFWAGEVFVNDLELAAEHQHFLERNGGR